MVSSNGRSHAQPPPEHSSAAEVGTGAARERSKEQLERSNHNALRPSDQPEGDYLFALGRAPHVGAVRPEEGFENIALPFDELQALLTHHAHRAKKDGPNFTRPMTGGDHSRSDANAGVWRLVPVDVDELQPEELPALKKW